MREMVGTELADGAGRRTAASDAVVLDVEDLAADGLGPGRPRGARGRGGRRRRADGLGPQPAAAHGLRRPARARRADDREGKPVRAALSRPTASTRGITLVAEDRKQQSLLPTRRSAGTSASRRSRALAIARLPEPARRAAAAGRDRQAFARALHVARAADPGAVGRQPAAGGLRPRDGHPAEPAAARRADPRRRRRRQGRDLPADRRGRPRADCAVLVASSELEELMHLCSRIVVHVRAAGWPHDRRAEPQFNKEAIIGAGRGRQRLRRAHRGGSRAMSSATRTAATRRARRAALPPRRARAAPAAWPRRRSSASCSPASSSSSASARQAHVRQHRQPAGDGPQPLRVRHPGDRREPGDPHRRHRPVGRRAGRRCPGSSPPGWSCNHGFPLSLAILVTLAMCAASASMHGWFVTRLNVPPFVITLVTYTAARGVAQAITKRCR